MANFSRVKSAGWALNEILTSAQMNALDIDHAASVNGAGGSYSGDFVWSGVHHHESLVEFSVNTTPIADSATPIELDPDDGQTQEFAVPAANRTHYMKTGGRGEEVTFTVLANTSYSITIKRTSGATEAIVYMNAGSYSSATIYHDGTNWRLKDMAGESAAGADA